MRYDETDFYFIAGGGKTSVMERVTNVFCGGGAVAYTNLQSANNANATPEKPSRSVPVSVNSTINMGNNKVLCNNRIESASNRTRISRNRAKNVPLAGGGTSGYMPPCTWEQLMQDDHFLSRFFLYFNASERRILAQVNFYSGNKLFFNLYSFITFSLCLLHVFNSFLKLYIQI